VVEGVDRLIDIAEFESPLRQCYALPPPHKRRGFMTALPTPKIPSKRDESWRYSDIDAVAALWPVPPAEVITLDPGEVRDAALLADGGVRDFAITLGKGAHYDFRILNIAERYSRVAIDVTLHAGADFNLGVAQIAGGDATVEVITTVTHAEPNATSQQTVRSVAGGKGTVTYLGKVAVARDAQHTDSAQDVKAMLLNRSATANAKPELEIFADDVKCAHGCAIGELDAQALFYMQSRGMTSAEAKQVLLQAFVAGVFDGAHDAERLQELALERLGELV
jgi:Fe-S cluster assembly protein SufD